MNIKDFFKEKERKCVFCDKEVTLNKYTLVANKEAEDEEEPLSWAIYCDEKCLFGWLIKHRNHLII